MNQRKHTGLLSVVVLAALFLTGCEEQARRIDGVERIVQQDGATHVYTRSSGTFEISRSTGYWIPDVVADVPPEKPMWMAIIRKPLGNTQVIIHVHTFKDVEFSN